VTTEASSPQRSLSPSAGQPYLPRTPSASTRSPHSVKSSRWRIVFRADIVRSAVCAAKPDLLFESLGLQTSQEAQPVLHQRIGAPSRAITRSCTRWPTLWRRFLRGIVFTTCCRNSPGMSCRRLRHWSAQQAHAAPSGYPVHQSRPEPQRPAHGRPIKAVLNLCPWLYR